MGQIHLLEDDVINKIAAGEVVDRPASVVKELVENALDSGATQIHIDLEDGGKQLIAVRDNGKGIAGEDMPLTIRRHATSKLASADDLFQIKSMGFRGEALASIAAVSRLTLTSRSAGDSHATRLHTDGGDSVEISTWNADLGTSVAVQDLFFNLPVRAGFLKSATAEFAHCLEWLQGLALAFPQVAFVLSHNKKEHLRLSGQNAESSEWRGEEALRRRFGDIFGADTGDALLYWRKNEKKTARIEALISPPGIERANSKQILIYVNNRLIKEAPMRYALLRGYHSHLLKGRYPIAALFLHVDPTLVDVNVHPAKTEVRFQYASEIQQLLAVGVRESLRSGAWAAPQSLGSVGVPELPVRPLSGAVPTSFAPSMRREQAALFGDGTARSVTERAVAPMSDLRSPRYFSETALFAPATLPLERFAARNSDVGEPPIAWSELNYIGSFARCYLLFAQSERLLVVDQHAFHERILYERFCRDRSLLSASQPLLVPEAIQLSPVQVAKLAERMAELQKIGFRLQRINENLFEVNAVPALLAKRDLNDLLAALSDDEPDSTLHQNAELGHTILATMACHAAVRAGEELTADELKELMRQASEVDFYHNCPHGRRVFRWWNVKEVAHWFDR